MKHVQQGYTLIELMIVVAIIGILASVAMPVYQNYTVRTQVAEGINLSGSAKTASTAFFQVRGTFPADNNQAGVADAASIQGKYVDSVSVVSEVITIRFGNEAHAMISGQTITLTADTTASGSVQWSCASGGVIATRHVPAVCR